MIHHSRWIRFVGIGEELRCPCGHRLDKLAAWQTEDLVCDKKGQDGKYVCGRTLWLIGGAWRIRGEPMLIVCEVSPTEMMQMKSGKMDVDELLAFLDLKFRKAA